MTVILNKPYIKCAMPVIWRLHADNPEQEKRVITMSHLIHYDSKSVGQIQIGINNTSKSVSKKETILTCVYLSCNLVMQRYSLFNFRNGPPSHIRCYYN